MAASGETRKNWKTRRRGLRIQCKYGRRCFYCNSQRPLTSFCVICIGFSSTPTPGPNRGITKICRVSPDKAEEAAFAAMACAGVSIGLLNVHMGRPRTGSQAGLTFVMAAKKGECVSRAASEERIKRERTLQPNLVRPVEFVEDDKLGRRAVEEVRGGVDEEVFLDAEGAVGDAACRGDLGV